MSDSEKTSTTSISSADLRRRGAILRSIANIFDAIGNQMDNHCIESVEIKGQATFDRAVTYLRGSVSSAQGAVLDKMTGLDVNLLIDEPEKAAQQIADTVKPPKKPKR